MRSSIRASTYFVCCTLATSFFLASGASSAAGAKDDKLWEAGIGVGGQVLNDYRGSSEEQTEVFPLPIFLYHGKIFKADREGVRGDFFEDQRFRLNFSAELALNTGNESNDARRGMPVLESALEWGPSLHINLTEESFDTGWHMRLSTRWVTTFGKTGLHQRGYLFNPNLTYIPSKLPGLSRDWSAQMNIGALYGSDSYHSYFYSVSPEYVLAERTQYNAEAGFSGWFSKWGVSRNFDKQWVGLSIRYDNLSGASFEDSPLVETEHYLSLSFLYAYIFF